MFTSQSCQTKQPAGVVSKLEAAVTFKIVRWIFAEETQSQLRILHKSERLHNRFHIEAQIGQEKDTWFESDHCVNYTS